MFLLTFFVIFALLIQFLIFLFSKNTRYSFQAAVLFLRNTYVNEGFVALWRGNSATMARIIPFAAIQFTAHEQWKKALQIEANPE